MAAKNSGWVTLLTLVVALSFVALGLFLGLISASRLSREARDVRGMPELDAATFRVVALQTPAALTGFLAENGAKADPNGLVIYWEQQWEVEYDEEDGWEGNWAMRRVEAPDLNLSLGGGSVTLYANPEVKFGGSWHEVLLHRPENAEEVEGFPEGSIRRVGFMDGDRVTVVGTKTGAVALTPERFYGGERADLVRDLGQSAFGQRVLGVVFGLVGVAILVVSLRPLWVK